MEYSEKYFKHIDNCKCDVDQIKETMEAAVKRNAPYQVDKDGNKLFYVDSFGYRGPIPGECSECYDAMSKARKEANKIPEGCTCIWVGNVIDIFEDTCPVHEE